MVSCYLIAVIVLLRSVKPIASQLVILCDNQLLNSVLLLNTAGKHHTHDPRGHAAKVSDLLYRFIGRECLLYGMLHSLRCSSYRKLHRLSIWSALSTSFSSTKLFFNKSGRHPACQSAMRGFLAYQVLLLHFSIYSRDHSSCVQRHPDLLFLPRLSKTSVVRRFTFCRRLTRPKRSPSCPDYLLGLRGLRLRRILSNTLFSSLLSKCHCP